MPPDIASWPICVIPARSGSRRIRGKNIRAFHGKPILAYAIETAMASRIFNRVVVSTDGDDVRRVARGYGARIHNRAKSLAKDEVGTQAVAAATINWWMRCTGAATPPPLVCCLYATTPLLTPEILRDALAQFRASGEPYCYGVDASGTDQGAFYFGTGRAFMDGVPLEARRKMTYLLPAERCCDINTEEDWQRAERMYAALLPAYTRIDGGYA